MDGPYVENLLVVELGASGAEERVEYTCYLDQQGKLFKLNRKIIRKSKKRSDIGWGLKDNFV